MHLCVDFHAGPSKGYLIFFLSNLNEEELLAEVQAINWEEVLPSAPDVNLIFDSFHAKITEIVDKHAPLRKLF